MNSSISCDILCCEIMAGVIYHQYGRLMQLVSLLLMVKKIGLVFSTASAPIFHYSSNYLPKVQALVLLDNIDNILHNVWSHFKTDFKKHNMLCRC